MEIQLSQNNRSKRDRLKGECETDLGSRCLASPTHRHLGSPGWMVLHDITQGWLRVWKPESLKARFSYKIWWNQKLCCILRGNHMLLLGSCCLRMTSVFQWLTLFLTPVGLGSMVHLFLALDALSHLLCKALGISLYSKHSKQSFAGLWYPNSPPSDSWSRKWEPKLDCQR